MSEENWQKELADELHKPLKRNFTRRRVIANHIDEIWCSDLVEMQQFSKWNKGYRYLLMVLDVFSKYGWIVPLKDKKGETVAEAFKKIFKEGRKPHYLWTDKGKEYYNKHVKELLDKNKITLYSTENEEKSSVCERWNRTIKTRMWKQFTVQGNTQYLDMLPKLVKQYNNTKGHAHAVGVQSRYKICNAKLKPVVFEPKMAGVCWKRKWKVQLMCIYMILTKTLNMPLF